MKQTEGIINNILGYDDTEKVEIVKLKDEDKIEITVNGKYAGRYLHYSPKIKGYEHFKDYNRFPIQLSAQNIIVIHHFSNKHEGMDQIFEEHTMGEDNAAKWTSNMKMYETSAEQLFDQLEGHYSDAFLEAVIVKATKLLAKHDAERDAVTEKYNASTGKNEPIGKNRAQKALDKAAKAIIKE